MSRIPDIIEHYLHNTATVVEIDELEQWVRASPENAMFFKKYVQEQEDKLKAEKRFDKEAAYQRFLELKRTEKQRGNVLKWVTIAAIIILFTGLDFLNKRNSQPFQLKEKTLNTNSILLTLEDGTTKILKENDSSMIINAIGDTLHQKQNNSLVYSTIKTAVSEIRYHTLEIPLGKTFRIQLSDGTLVWLNAGSSLRFPVNFTQQMKNRIVELKGEAFFEVAKNKDKPFIVSTPEIKVKVLGTRFNVSAYEEDKNIKTTLVEGAVSIFDANDLSKNSVLKPKYQTVFHKSSGEMKTQEVSVEKYIAWIDNRLYFENDPFAEITKQIERSYNVKIINHNNELKNIRFTGEFDIEDVNEIFKTFATNTPFTYTITKNEITIKK